ncbi:MAG: GNAT family N-acetyltransferase, partial [Alphaproteobacteria bacterium]
MTRTKAQDGLPQSFYADALSGALASEHIYFEAAARTAFGPGWRFAAMPGLGALAAGAVDFLDADRPVYLENLITRLEAEFLAAGARYYRFYVDPQDSAAGKLLAAKGYARRTEIISVRPISGSRNVPRHELSVTRIESDEEWKDRLKLQQATDESSDGHTNAPELWVEMERRKCQSGRMEAFLLRRNGEVVAAAGIVSSPPATARLKNVLVHPDHRRKGIGTAAIEIVSAKGGAAAARQIVTFAVAGTIGERLYLKLDFLP